MKSTALRKLQKLIRFVKMPLENFQKNNSVGQIEMRIKMRLVILIIIAGKGEIIDIEKYTHSNLSQNDCMVSTVAQNY